MLALGLSVPAVGSANASMGLAFERWDVGVWLAYVGIMVLFEAWFIGLRWLPGGKALLFSLAANLATGVIGVLFCGAIASPFLHGALVGTRSSPNPLGETILLLAVSAVPSAAIELAVWQRLARRVEVNPEVHLGKRVWLAHALGVLIGLIVVLSPDDPHKVATMFATSERRWVIIKHIDDIEREIRRSGRLPEIRAGARPGFNFPDEVWAAFSIPEFDRFATGPSREIPWEWNTALSGRALTKGEDDWQWLARRPGGSMRVELNLANGEIQVR